MKEFTACAKCDIIWSKSVYDMCPLCEIEQAGQAGDCGIIEDVYTAVVRVLNKKVKFETTALCFTGE